MKRFTVWLCVLCLTLGLASCSSQVNDGSVSTESGELSESVESTVYSSEETSEEVFDPFTVELTDSSTGKTSPRLVETIYPTEDVVIADIIPTEDGYAVNKDGVGDSTAGIQKALNDCFDNGGGTVYLPSGNYVIKGKIFIPAFVTLRGDWQDPDTGTDYGTIIHVYTESDDGYAKGKTVSEGTFMLGGSGGVVGMTVYYPKQSLTTVKPYPFTFYTDGMGANYMLSTVKNVTVINGYRGIGACCLNSADGGGAHEQLTVENFKGTFLYCGTEVYNQADVGTWQNVTISNKYWIEAKGEYIKSANADALNAYTKENTVGLKLGDLEWTEFESLKVSGCKIGIEIVKGKRIHFAGSVMDVEIRNCTTGIQLRDLDSRWGMLIARGVIEGGINNKALGTVKLCDVKVSGNTKGKIDRTATDDLSAYAIDYERSYQKPIGTLYVAELDKTGATDVSDALQLKLDEAAGTGGIVYLQAGNYRLDKPISVPSGVELRGASSVAGRDQGGMSLGTVIYAYYGDDDGVNPENDPALITLTGNNSGINGIRIIYPENGPKDADLNTTYTVRGKGDGVYIVNSMISASAYGVDFKNCDNHFIKKVTSCCYYNSYMLGGKNGMLNGCLQNGTVVYRTNIGSGFHKEWPTNEALIWEELFNPITRAKNRYIILDGAENQQIYNTFIYGACNMIECNNSTVLACNIGSDNLGSSKLVMNGGEMTVINSMRYNGSSYKYTDGVLSIYNRLTINNKTEKTEILGK